MDSFLGTPHCCMRDGLCEWFAIMLNSITRRADQIQQYRLVLTSWAKRVRGASLKEEKWHSFGKAEAAGSRAWVTDFGRQAASQVLENHKGRYMDCGHSVPAGDPEARRRILLCCLYFAFHNGRGRSRTLRTAAGGAGSPSQRPTTTDCSFFFRENKLVFVLDRPPTQGPCVCVCGSAYLVWCRVC